jgi:predicted dehydrogenase
MIDRREFIQKTFLTGTALTLGIPGGFASAQNEIRIGIIGLDTLHSPTFTKIINDPANAEMTGVKVISAYPYGSKRIESSARRIPEFTKEVEGLGVTITNTIDEVISSSDVIMLMTNDGGMHYEQLLPVLQARKPVFLNKPVGANLGEVLKIFSAVKEYGVPMFTSSALRYLEGAQNVRYQNAVGKVIGADVFSPQKIEQFHTDLFWYGIHGVEILFTLMGTGCESVRRETGTSHDMVIGKWSDGRIGTYRGDLETRQSYGGTAYGTEGVLNVGPFAGYQALVSKIVQFFRESKSPVEEKETLEIYTFMEAADESKRMNGAWINLQEVYDQAKRKMKG